MDEGMQTIIIDPKRTYHAQHEQRILVFRPIDLQDFIFIVSEIKNYLSIRLSQIIILDFPYFFRDFQGTAAKNVVINDRAFAVCVSMLEKLASSKISITCGTYENPLSRNYPLFQKILNYYDYGAFKILKLENNSLFLRQEDGNIEKIIIQ